LEFSSFANKVLFPSCVQENKIITKTLIKKWIAVSIKHFQNKHKKVDGNMATDTFLSGFFDE